MGEQGCCSVVRGGDAFVGKQGPTSFAGISAESAGARGLCVHLLRFGPGERARAHLPANASATEPAEALIPRTDPNEQESVVLLPELEELVPPA